MYHILIIKDKILTIKDKELQNTSPHKMEAEYYFVILTASFSYHLTCSILNFILNPSDL